MNAKTELIYLVFERAQYVACELFKGRFTDGSMRRYRLNLSESDDKLSVLMTKIGDLSGNPTYSIKDVAAFTSSPVTSILRLPDYEIRAVNAPHYWEGPVEWYEELFIIRRDHLIDWGIAEGKTNTTFKP